MTSLTLDEFRQLVPPFEAAFQAHMAPWRLDGKPRTARRYTTYQNCPLPTPEDRLLFILVYLKTYPLQVVQGRLFGMGQSKAHQWIHVLLVVLRVTLPRLWSCRRRGRRARPIHRRGHWPRRPPPPFWPRWDRTAHRAPPGPG